MINNVQDVLVEHIPVKDQIYLFETEENGSPKSYDDKWTVKKQSGARPWKIFDSHGKKMGSETTKSKAKIALKEIKKRRLGC